MPKGLPASYIRKARRELGKGASFSRIFKRAWQLYKGSKVYKALKGNPGNPRKKSKKRKGGSRKVARRKSRRRSRSLTIPLAPTLGIASGFLTSASGTDTPINAFINGRWQDGMWHLMMNFTGYNFKDGSWNITRAKALWATIAGLLIHKFVGGSPLNLNRLLARNKVPLIRI